MILTYIHQNTGKNMKRLITVLLIALTLNSFGQRVKKKDIMFSSMEEVEQAVDRLNDLRTIPGLAEQATGINLPDNIVMSTLEIDVELQSVAEKRVIEMIKNNKLTHKTKIKGVGSECICYNYEFCLHGAINQFIVDKGVKYLGHRKALLYQTIYTKIGYAGGWYNGKFWTCVLLS